jgi:hypothetical protein
MDLRKWGMGKERWSGGRSARKKELDMILIRSIEEYGDQMN